MRSFSVEVFADGRPILLDNPTLVATNAGVALRRGYVTAKPRIKRGAKQITVRVTALHSFILPPDAPERAHEAQTTL